MKVSWYTYTAARKDDWKVLIFALIMLVGIGAIIGGIVSILLVIWLTGGNASPSAAISAPTLSFETLNQATESTELQNGVLPPTTPAPDAQSTAIIVTIHNLPESADSW